MACACKVNQQIDYLHKKYGDNLPKNKKTNIRGSVLAKIENLFICLMLIPVIPFMVVYVIIKAVRGEHIVLDKIFRLNKNVGEQQVI